MLFILYCRIVLPYIFILYFSYTILSYDFHILFFSYIVLRGGKIGPARWASPVRPKLGPGWAIKFLARKKPGQIWPGPVWPSPVWPGPARPARIFFALKCLFGPTGPVFKAGWAVKILARKNRANFGPARFWPGPAQPGPPDCHL